MNVRINMYTVRINFRLACTFIPLFVVATAEVVEGGVVDSNVVVGVSLGRTVDETITVGVTDTWLFVADVMGVVVSKLEVYTGEFAKNSDEKGIE